MLLTLFGRDSAFRVRDFRLFFYGQLVSSVGTWLQGAALGWLIFKLSHSEFLVGVNGALIVAPAIILSPVAGMVIDTFHTKHVLLVTNTLSMLQATALAILVLVHQPSVWELNALTCLLGIINAFDGTARHTSIAEIVPHEDIKSATGLNSSLVSAGVMLGTACAGLIIWLFGVEVTFIINAISYIPVLITVLMLRFGYAAAKQARTSLNHILPAVRYAFVENKMLRSLMFLIFITMTFSFPYRTLMPAIARVVFHGNALVFGLLGSMPGCGAVVGGITISRYSKQIPFPVFVIGGCSLIGVCLVAFSLTKSAYLAVPLLFFAGFGALASTSMLRARAQEIARDPKNSNFLGRITSFNMMVFLGGIAFGNAAIGKLAQTFSLPLAMAICGLALLTVSGYLLLTKQQFE